MCREGRAPARWTRHWWRCLVKTMIHSMEEMPQRAILVVIYRRSERMERLGEEYRSNVLNDR